jgi:hypothetical protein
MTGKAIPNATANVLNLIEDASRNAEAGDFAAGVALAVVVLPAVVVVMIRTPARY